MTGECDLRVAVADARWDVRIMRNRCERDVRDARADVQLATRVCGGTRGTTVATSATDAAMNGTKAAGLNPLELEDDDRKLARLMSIAAEKR